MHILDNHRTQPARIESVREVQLEADITLRTRLGHFYESIVGLPSLPVWRQLPGGVGFGDARRSVFFLFRHDRSGRGYRSRMTIVVPSLDAVARRLEAAEIAFQRRRGFFSCDDCLLAFDPSGNPIEIRRMHYI